MAISNFTVLMFKIKKKKKNVSACKIVNFIFPLGWLSCRKIWKQGSIFMWSQKCQPDFPTVKSDCLKLGLLKTFKPSFIC